jgi:hypothetical protein
MIIKHGLCIPSGSAQLLNFSTGKGGGGLDRQRAKQFALHLKMIGGREKRIVINRLARPLGVWQGYGEVPTGQTGVFVRS